jgi:hypothetical protein
MTATVHDLITEKSKRGKAPLHFDTDLDALAYITAELDEIRAECAGELLIPAEPLDDRLARIRAVAGAIATLYRHDERDTR